MLVAEVMAQQTHISRVDQAWTDFLERFPTPLALAKASTADVLRAWSGLGYNRRAIYLQRAARVIEAEHGGCVPGSLEALQRLPGVGAYTSRAVAALAYGQPVAAVDTNVRRVVSRLLGRRLGERDLQATADGLVGRRDAATWVHALMELGATICRARRPECDICPVRRWCASAGQVGGPRQDPARAVTTAPARLAPRSPAVPFERTTRWLRGHIVAILRDVDERAWAQLPDSMGEHGPDHIMAAVAALHHDGLLEQRADGSVRIPSMAP